MFITFEGVDGSGKTSQIRNLAARMQAEGLPVTLTREPGGSVGAEEIRALLLNGDADRWSPETEILLFTAARRDHLEKTVWPAMDAGEIVLCDRFVDTTRAYQGQKGPEQRAMVENLHASMIGTLPDLTVLLDIDPDLALARSLGRLAAAGSGEDRMEKKGLAFQHGLRATYLEIAENEPRRVMVVSALGTPEEVATRIWHAVRERMPVTSGLVDPTI